MKRLPALIALLLAGQALAVGSINDWLPDENVGIAYLGNHADIAALHASPNYPRYRLYFPGLEDVTAFDLDRGDEVYLVIPASDDIDITLHDYDKYGKESKDGLGKRLHHVQGKSLLLRINPAGEDLNTILVARSPNGDTTQYLIQPAEEGRLELNLEHIQEGLLPADLSPADLVTPTQQADSFIGITARVENGDVIIDIDPNHPALGDYLDTSRITQRQHTVQGLAAPAQSIYISDIGQDSNPILCIINANHDLEILSLFNAIRHDDWQSSGALHPDTHHFAHRRGHYANIYTVNSQMQETEIELPQILGDSEGERHYQAQDGKRHSLYLSPDWKIAYRVVDANGKLLEEKRGYYREFIHNDNEQLATYHYEFPDSKGQFLGEADDEDNWLIRGIDGETVLGGNEETPANYAANRQNAR